jgi:putative methyltransferase (TIGR04325 family)
MQPIKQIAHDLIPPLLGALYHKAVRTSGFFGNYRTWAQAQQASEGYDSDVILNKVKDALLKVKTGDAVYERDSVLFDKVEYSWPLLAGLLWIASREEKRLNLVDFGGSLGSSYFQNRKLLAHLHELKWNIVEQSNFVECGKQYFEDEHLQFHYHLDDCLREQRPNTILLSSVIQYLEKPYDLLKEIIGKRLKYVLFDRTPFLHRGEDRITVQKVPAEIYRASYPAWFFNERKFLDYITGEYELIADFESNDHADIPSVFKGYIFRLKNAD